MKVKSVMYSALFNLGNYSNEKVGLTADLEEGDTVEDVVEALRKQAHALAHKEEDLKDRFEQQRELRRIRQLVEVAREEWNKTREFLIAQGLRPDAPEFPIGAALAIAAAPVSEHTEFVGADEEPENHTSGYPDDWDKYRRTD